MSSQSPTKRGGTAGGRGAILTSTSASQGRRSRGLESKSPRLATGKSSSLTPSPATSVGTKDSVQRSGPVDLDDFFLGGSLHNTRSTLEEDEELIRIQNHLHQCVQDQYLLVADSRRAAASSPAPSTASAVEMQLIQEEYDVGLVSTEVVRTPRGQKPPWSNTGPAMSGLADEVRGLASDGTDAARLALENLSIVEEVEEFERIEEALRLRKMRLLTRGSTTPSGGSSLPCTAPRRITTQPIIQRPQARRFVKRRKRSSGRAIYSVPETGPVPMILPHGGHQQVSMAYLSELEKSVEEHQRHHMEQLRARASQSSVPRNPWLSSSSKDKAYPSRACGARLRDDKMFGSAIQGSSSSTSTAEEQRTNVVANTSPEGGELSTTVSNSALSSPKSFMTSISDASWGDTSTLAGAQDSPSSRNFNFIEDVLLDNGFLPVDIGESALVTEGFGAPATSPSRLSDQLYSPRSAFTPRSVTSSTSSTARSRRGRK